MQKVSVIMAVFNGENTINESINSILNQTHEDLELIIVDDGSTDGTKEIVKKIKDKRVKYLYQKNYGFPAVARNVGIRESTGEMIAFCDMDDVWYVNKLEKQVEAYRTNENRGIGLIVSSADVIDINSNIIGHNNLEDTYLEKKEVFSTLVCGDFITACTVLIPKRVINEVGYLDENLRGNDDYDLWLRITNKYGILAINQPLCGWRSHDKSFSAQKSKIYIENEKIFRKLEKTSSEKIILIGHGKNLMRVIVSLIIEKKFTELNFYRGIIKKYPISLKAKLFLILVDMSKKLSHFLILILRRIGKVSL